MNLFPSMAPDLGGSLDGQSPIQVYEAEAALEPEKDHPPGERFPLRFSAALILAMGAAAWLLIWSMRDAVRLVQDMAR